MLPPNLIDHISQDIYRQFPEMKGVDPKVRSQSDSKNKSDHSQSPSYLLTFQTHTSLSNGMKIARLVRVTVDQNGKIIKISTSR